MASSQLTRGLVSGNSGKPLVMGGNPIIIRDLKDREAQNGLTNHTERGTTARKGRSGPSQPTGKGNGQRLNGGASITGGGI